MSITHFIGRKAGASLLHSARSAKALNRPFTLFITIDYWKYDVSENEVFDSFVHLRKCFQKWSARGTTRRKANGTPTYAYVHENPNGHTHTHWMVHINAESRAEFVTWLQKHLRGKYGRVDGDILEIKPVYNDEGLKLYFAKGLDPHYAQFCKIEHEYQGTIDKRRCDTSRNLGPSFWKEQKRLYRMDRAA